MPRPLNGDPSGPLVLWRGSNEPRLIARIARVEIVRFFGVRSRTLSAWFQTARTARWIVSQPSDCPYFSSQLLTESIAQRRMANHDQPIW